jgi:hypothetical protein
MYVFLKAHNKLPAAVFCRLVNLHLSNSDFVAARKYNYDTQLPWDVLMIFLEMLLIMLFYYVAFKNSCLVLLLL